MTPKLLTGITAVALMIGATALLTNRPSHPTSNNDISDTTAMITNLAGNSGGSGVVWKSSATTSYVLTNAHVCGVAKAGGIVSTNKAAGLVTSYRLSKIHDICLLETNVDFGVNTEVANNAPSEMEEAIVSGHPQLLPTIITKGNFSSKEVIQIMVGIRACTKEDFESEELGLICMFLGGIPQIRTYRAQVSAALIQPGSSGSAVFNSSGYISGLVFAGSGNLGYSHLVPQEYVKNFVDNELPTLSAQFPEEKEFGKSERESHKKLRDACKESTDTINYSIVKDYCKYVDTDLIFYQE